MDYEAELDTQIAALEKEIDRRKRIRAFWMKSIPGREALWKKWKPMLQHMRIESNQIEVGINLEIMNVLLDRHKFLYVSQYVMPVMARCDENGNPWK